MMTMLVARQTNEVLADNSTYALYGSAAVLTLAMLSFALDLSRRQVRQQREEVAEQVHAEGSTAVLTRTETEVEPEPKRQWAGIGMSLSWLGTILLVVAIALRGASVHRAPLGNMYEFSMAATAFTMIVFLIWSLKRDLRWLGVFVTAPVVLIEMLAAVVLYTDATQLLPSLKSYWLVIHVTVATLSIGLFTVGCVLAILYLVQERRESRAELKPGFMDRLPNARALDQASYAIHVVAYPLWTFTVIAGAIWAQEAWGRYWGWDPKEVWSFVIFAVYTAYMHSRLTSGWNARRSAYLAIAGFVCIILNYTVVNMYFVGMHSYSGL
ncbi:c-type cytochrome biogenesis protein CcsB [Dermacoccaceae bacterium W4C1]